MTKNIIIGSATFNDVPSVTFNKAGGGTCSFVDTDSGNATAADILYQKKAWVGGEEVTGTVTFSTVYTGSTTPASSLGSNGDLYFKLA